MIPEGEEPQERIARWHRIRFYPKVWSNFDSVELCKRPAYCIGCEFGHPFCSAGGQVLSAAPSILGDENG